MFVLLQLIILGFIYFACPFWLKLIICAINCFFPDPIPFVDEIIMIGGIFSHLNILGHIAEAIEVVVDWIKEHKALCVAIIVLIIVIIMFI